MSVLEVGRLALINLGRRRVRSLLTSVGVLVGVVTIVTLVALSYGVQQEIERNVAALGLETVTVAPQEAEGDELLDRFVERRRLKPITDATVEALARMPGVRQVEPEVALPASANLGVAVGGREVRVRTTSNPHLPFAVAAPLLTGADKPEEGEAVLSRGLLARAGIGADDLEGVLGEKVNVVARLPRGEMRAFPMTVAGISEGDDPRLQLSLADSVAIKSWWYGTPDLLETLGYDSVMVRTESPAAVPGVAEGVRAMGFRVNTVQAVLDMVNKMAAILGAMLAAVGVLATFVASLGVVNTMIMAVYERTREIGVLKAVGASRGDIRRLFVVEATLIGLIGGVGGLIAGWALSLLVDWAAHQYLAAQNLTFVGPIAQVTWWLAAGAIAFACTVGLLAGLYPAERATRLEPVAALRHQ